MDSICVNLKCREEGRCDFCNARCPYYTDIDSLLKTLNLTEFGKAVIDNSHATTMNEYFNDAQMGG